VIDRYLTVDHDRLPLILFVND